MHTLMIKAIATVFSHPVVNSEVPQEQNAYDIQNPEYDVIQEERGSYFEYLWLHNFCR